MEEELDGEELGTPFWVQSSTNLRHADRLRRRISSLFFNSGLVVFLLLVMAVFFLVFVVPSTLSFSAQIFRPNSVKKSWDSLNIVLVLVAVVFGFLSKIKNEDRYSSSYYDEFQASPSKETQPHKSNPPTPNHWYNYNSSEGQKRSNPSTPNHWYEQQYQDYEIKMEHNKDSVLRRNSSSYPDLRDFSSNRWDYGYYHRRYYDDIHVEASRVPDPGQYHRRHRSLENVDGLIAPPPIKAAFVDTLEETGQVPIPDPGRIHRRHRSLENITTNLNDRELNLSESWQQRHSATYSLEDVAGVRPPGPTRAIFVDTLTSRSQEPTSSQPSSSQPPPEPAQSPSPVEYEEKPEIRSFEGVARRKERPSRRLYKDHEYMNPITNEPSPASEQPEGTAAESPEIQENPIRPNENAARRRGTSRRNQNKEREPMNPITTPSPPPPPPPPPAQLKSSKSATKDFLNSLYHKKKRKQRQKSVENLDFLHNQSEAPLSFQIPPPSPPPPSVFQNLFSSKKHKRKRTITVTASPTEPPPASQLPPHTAARAIVTSPTEARETKPVSQTPLLPNRKPPRPLKMSFDEVSNSGGESPVNRIPPPPPPPPPGFLKTHAWKFVVQGDYVRIDSTTSSRSGSPELDDVESDATPSAADGGGATPFHPSPVFCPSPDVNSKAESFITNFRAKLKLEKIHSMKKRELGLSGLGPNLGPS